MIKPIPMKAIALRDGIVAVSMTDGTVIVFRGGAAINQQFTEDGCRDILAEATRNAELYQAILDAGMFGGKGVRE